ncbi:MAG TPA: hydroxymethylbilane synthase [Longimicrobiales bacterium]|nr:hydroxymethylbilane synthase [Longimicrobiales bacterium]
MALRVGTRGSALALWQARHVKQRLEEAHPGLLVDIVILHTTGDRITDVPLAKIGDKGLFTKELDRALDSGQVDLCVHSLKDVPTRMADGLALGAIMEREDPRDAYVPGQGSAPSLADLPAGACLGTSSLRRRAQLLHARPDLRIEDLRGNLDTRLAKLADGKYDAIILALAGLRRLGHESAVTEVLGPPTWLPAVGQGALAIAIREGDAATAGFVAVLDHPPTRAAVGAERAFLRTLEGGCQIPIGALATVHGDALTLDGFVASIDGREYLRSSTTGPTAEAGRLGRRLAEELLADGAHRVLAEVRRLSAAELPHASAP